MKGGSLSDSPASGSPFGSNLSEQGSSLDVSSAGELGDLPQSEWEPKLMKSRPDLLQLRETSRPLSGTLTYGRLFSASKTEDKNVITHKRSIQMILKFLADNGMQKAKEKIEQETGFDYSETEPVPSLRSFLELGIKDVSTMFDPSLSSLSVEDDAEVQAFDYQPQQEFDSDLEIADTNIWNEGEDTPTNLVLATWDAESKQQYAQYATFNKLVELITSKRPGIELLQFRQIFLGTYRSFASPEQLFDKLMQRYNIPQSVLEKQADGESYKKEVRLLVVLSIKSWAEKYPGDFNERMIGKLRHFTEVQLPEDGHKNFSKSLTMPLNKLLHQEVESEDALKDFNIKIFPDPKVPRKLIFSPSLRLVDVDPEEIARQMSLIDQKLICAAKPVELLSKNWIKSNPRSSMISAILNRSNQIAQWVASSILRETHYKNRTRVIVRFLDIARFLKHLNNFNSMAAIFMGLMHGSVYRLKHSFGELDPNSKRHFQIIRSFMDPTNNYQRYREIVSEINAPCIPFLGAHLQRIVIIEDSIPGQHQSMINFEKRRILYEQTKEIMRCQDLKYNFLPILQVSVFLQKFDVIKDESEMYKQSLLLEPKGISATDLVAYEEAQFGKPVVGQA
eukprot:TRINITY_DN863_c0_g1_i1.p1 TRINITY_DN863_c0_g1~~TRINITY_DN863_c0_g1_i1.p1  ORF type:complete len:638 (-),score=231.16 TRINITY_DN863_c0_g1_i1:33-1892(-)